MTDMVEKVARAIYESQPLFMSGVGMDVNTLTQVPWEKLEPEDREDAMEAGMAAIRALRRMPTEAMVLAGQCGPRPTDAILTAESVVHRWQAMISAALSPAATHQE